MEATKLVHEPLWISKVKAIHWLLSKVTQIQHFQTFFPKKNSKSIEAIFHVEPSWNGRMEVSANGLCHMTKVAAMPIYAKKLSKSSSLEPKGRWTWNLVCSIEYSSNTKFVQMMPLCWHWCILRQGQIWSSMLLYGKKLKQWIYQKLL